MPEFPDSFLWGAALSAYAVEGGNTQNDWGRWEQRAGRIRDDANAMAGSDHFNRYEADFDLAKKLGCRSLFFPIEWNRVHPAPEAFDETAIAHYHAVLDALVSRGIEPVCMLHHVTAPTWFSDRGGWAAASAPEAFARYTERMAWEYASKCRWWIPLHEPVYTLTMGYIERLWPPASANLIKATRAQENVAAAQTLAYDAIHEQRSDTMVGISVRGRVFAPLDERSSWDLRTARREHRRCNLFYFNVITEGRWPWFEGGKRNISEAMDFVALSYFGSETVRFAALKPSRLLAQLTDSAGNVLPEPRPRTDPGGLRALLRRMGRYDAPIVVTGNGIATADDGVRCHYLLDHLGVIRSCLDEGVDIRGYFHYSLLDGFEWTDGYSARYGLIHVDRETFARTPNPSAYLYKDICEHGALREGAIAKHCPDWRRDTERP